MPNASEGVEGHNAITIPYNLATGGRHYRCIPWKEGEMTALNWVKKKLEFAIAHDETLEDLAISVQAVVTRLNISPLEDEEKKGGGDGQRD